MRDHGGQPDLDIVSGELENKLDVIIRELRNVLKETIAEGGKRKIYLFIKKKRKSLIIRNGNVSLFGNEFNFIGT
jgi:hypothetical protein